MSAPTVTVTATISGQDGLPIEGATVTMVMDRAEFYQGFVVKESVSATTNSSGVATLAVFPNALGANGSQYKVTIITPGQTIRSTAVVPDSNCNLHDIMQVPPYPAISLSQAAMTAAQNYAAQASASASTASGHATTAGSYAGTASGAATLAQGYAISAAADAVTASNAAISATASAAAASSSAAAAAASAASVPSVGIDPGDVPTNADLGALAYVDELAVLKNTGNTKIAATATGATVTGTLIADGVSVGDSEYIKIGNSDDVLLYHNGTNTFFTNATGQLSVTQYSNTSAIVALYYNGSSNETLFSATPNGSVDLYYDNTKRLETNSSGVNVIGSLTVGGVAVGGSSKWTSLTATTDFSTTAASTSTITMNTDQTATIKAGMAVKFTLSGTVYYAIVSAITSNLLTIAGAPLTTTASALTALSYGLLPPIVERIAIPGYWADAADTALIANDLSISYVWRGPKAYLVQIGGYVRTTDSGASKPRLNARIGSTTTDYVSTSNSNAGLEMTAATTWYRTGIDIASAKYTVSFADVVELKSDGAGSNDDSSDLFVELVFVVE
jgi:hypothetical protein